MKTSIYSALALSIIITLWMVSGSFSNAQQTENITSQASKSKYMKVEFQASKAETITRKLILQGSVSPIKEVALRAETSGQVESVIKNEGEFVKKGDVLLTIKQNDRQIKLAKAKAKLLEKKNKYAAVKEMGSKGYASDNMLDEANAELKSAEADVENIKLEISHTIIKAPIDGYISIKYVELGDYIEKNNEVVKIVDNSSLKVTVHVPQQEYNNVSLGNKAKILFATGQVKAGYIKFISPQADSRTHSFRTEILINNTENLPSGTSATASIETHPLTAHYVPISVLTLDQYGEIGIKSLNAKNKVEFNRVKIINSDESGLWVSGLPSKANVIVTGQGFVDVGEEVTPFEIKINSIIGTKSSEFLAQSETKQ